MKIGIRVNSLLYSLLSVFFPIQFLTSSLHKLIEFPGSKLAGGNIAGILPKCLAAHGSIENFNGLQTEARSDLDQSQLLYIILLGKLLFMLVHNLVDTEPHSVVKVVKAEHMVYEGL